MQNLAVVAAAGWWVAELDSQKRCTFLKVRLEQSDRPLRNVPEVLSENATSGSSSMKASLRLPALSSSGPACSSFTSTRDPRVKGGLPVGRLKKRLLAACLNRLVCGFESLLCPFFHRLSFDPVPERSFPDLTIFGVENSRVDCLLQLQMTLSLDKYEDSMPNGQCSQCHSHCAARRQHISFDLLLRSES
ncbi:hypothetical protein INR49_001065 [Caranx melampygus]|nr:hypothetical protein INR49_001065 [Caranx melampygus]